MSDPTKRFSNRVENYLKYRPGYPPAILDLLKSQCGLTSASGIADVGSGTGILSELFLKNGNRVIGIEPNEAMRAAGAAYLSHYANFSSVAARAEATSLPPTSVDFITAGQAFHWFEPRSTRREFERILTPTGWVVLIWNERRLDSTPFLRSYEDLLLKYGTDYQKVRHERTMAEVDGFFAPEAFEMGSFENSQQLDWESFKGRVLSSSYTPEPEKPEFGAMLTELRELFAAHASGGRVAFDYDARIFYGRLAHPRSGQSPKSTIAKRDF